MNERIEMAERDEGREAAWHARTGAETLKLLATSDQGLSSAEAAARKRRYGPNQLPAAARRSPLLRFLAQFNNALIYFLLAAAVAAWVLDHRVDASVIIAVVLINAIVGYVQEDKAEKALDAIRKMISPSASVWRDGQRISLPVVELVPGDVVRIEAGDRVPADLRLIHARGLLIDEAMLTGESVAAGKNDAAAALDAPLGDRSGMAFSGTLVAAGQGTGVVVATGAATEIGRISALIEGVEQFTTPLLRQINQFGQRFTWIAMVGAVLLFLFATLVRAYPWPDALIAVVALAVGVVPEGLPAVITITLAIGVQRMAARKAVIRRLPAVETLGAISVICSDKTGTLTRNEMTARRLVVPGHTVLVSGSGYTPQGSLTVAGDDEDGAAIEAVMPLVRSGLLCGNAHLRKVGEQWVVEGDPMEGALSALAMKAGADPDHLRAEWRRTDEIPFDAEYRFMATRHHASRGGGAIFVKGAPERVLGMCREQARGANGDETEPLDTAYWADAIAQAAAEGQRVLGFAMKHTAEAAGGLDFADLDHGLVFLGIIGFVDPPRDEAIEAIAACHSAGIDVKMITGDHAATAAAIARQLGLDTSKATVTGADVDQTSDRDLVRLVANSAVFARTNPEHKLRIVRALQSTGAIVAMTGDGVNDAPALRRADVGVAMGRKGTEAAKEAAEMVLADDNFASIAYAVEEGRTVYGNLKKAIVFILPTNMAQAGMVLIAILLGITLPITPVQILWVNMVTAVTLALALAFERPEPEAMCQPPRNPNEPLLTRFMLWRIVFVTVFLVAGSLGMFLWELERGVPLEIARTAAINALVMGEIFYLFNCRRLTAPVVGWSGLFGNRAVLIAIGVLVVLQGLFTYLPVLQALFATAALDAAAWGRIVLFGVIVYGVVEIEKAVIRGNYKPDLS